MISDQVLCENRSLQHPTGYRFQCMVMLLWNRVLQSSNLNWPKKPSWRKSSSFGLVDSMQSAQICCVSFNGKKNITFVVRFQLQLCWKCIWLTLYIDKQEAAWKVRYSSPILSFRKKDWHLACYHKERHFSRPNIYQLWNEALPHTECNNHCSLFPWARIWYY